MEHQGIEEAIAPAICKVVVGVAVAAEVVGVVRQPEVRLGQEVSAIWRAMAASVVRTTLRSGAMVTPGPTSRRSSRV
jgi:hypothetical protein